MSESEKLTEQLEQVEANLAALREALLQAAKEAHEAKQQAQAAREASDSTSCPPKRCWQNSRT